MPSSVILSSLSSICDFLSIFLNSRVKNACGFIIFCNKYYICIYSRCAHCLNLCIVADIHVVLMLGLCAEPVFLMLPQVWRFTARARWLTVVYHKDLKICTTGEKNIVQLASESSLQWPDTTSNAKQSLQGLSRKELIQDNSLYYIENQQVNTLKPWIIIQIMSFVQD